MGLENLKVGDELHVTSNSSDVGRIEKVEKITPSGRFITRTGTFNQDGSLRGRSGWNYTHARLPTEKSRAVVHRKETLDKVRSIGWHLVKTGALEHIIEMAEANNVEVTIKSVVTQ